MNKRENPSSCWGIIFRNSRAVKGGAGKIDSAGVYRPPRMFLTSDEDDLFLSLSIGLIKNVFVVSFNAGSL